jgi:multidrug resistance efflux pump
VTQAKATLDLKQKGPRPEDIAVAQVRVQQAQTALEQAQAALAKAKLIAPFDATITDVTPRVGEMVQAGAPLVTLADLSQLRVETTDLDEFGTARVKVGQAARITVNAFSDKTLGGKVTDIAQQSVTLPTGDISYVVTLALDKQDPELRWGMTVKVEFQQ